MTVNSVEEKVGPGRENFDRLVGARVMDVLVTGYVDRDGNRLRFSPLPSSVYLELESGFLELRTVRDEGRMTVGFVEEPRVPEALLDNDDEFCLGSRGMDVLGEAFSGMRVTQVRGVTSSGAGEPGTEYDCLEFRFEDGGYLFADPAYPLGIRIGGEGAYERLLEMSAGRPAGIAVGRRFVWTP